MHDILFYIITHSLLMELVETEKISILKSRSRMMLIFTLVMIITD